MVLNFAKRRDVRNRRKRRYRVFLDGVEQKLCRYVDARRGVVRVVVLMGPNRGGVDLKGRIVTKELRGHVRLVRR